MSYDYIYMIIIQANLHDCITVYANLLVLQCKKADFYLQRKKETANTCQSVSYFNDAFMNF